MYPECRHIKPNGKKCSSPSLGRGHWCYFHDRIHRKTAHYVRPSKADTSETATETRDSGAIPVPAPAPAPAIELPFLEDAGIIQLALTQILQALANNQLDARRAGLLLYGLQIASNNTKHSFVSFDPVRVLTYATDGAPLGPAVQGWDVEDYPDDEDEDEEAND